MTTAENLEYMLSLMPSEYDTSPGSLAYDILYPVAQKLADVDAEYDAVQNNTLAVTATGKHLDYKVAEQAIMRREGVKSYGTVRLYGNRGETAYKGYKIASDTLMFELDEAATIPEAGYIDVTAHCCTVGLNGNVAIGEINRFPVTIPGISRVENITAFTGGADEENDLSLRQRFFDKIENPETFENVYYYKNIALSVPGVGNADVIRCWNGRGTVKVIITGQDNAPADQTLINAVASAIAEKDTVSVAEVTVVSATSTAITINAAITYTGSSIDRGAVYDDMEAQIKQYFISVGMGGGIVSYAQLCRIITSVEGVADCTDMTANGAKNNISIAAGNIVVLEALNIE